MSDLRDKIRGCLVGVAIGDALGMPTEYVPDGWILTSAVARSLIRCGKFEMADQADEFERATKNYVAWPNWANSKGNDNRVAIKVAPLAIVRHLTGHSGADKSGFPTLTCEGRDYLNDILAFGSMTHDDIRASIGAVAVISAINVFTCQHDPEYQDWDSGRMDMLFELSVTRTAIKVEDLIKKLSTADPNQKQLSVIIKRAFFLNSTMPDHVIDAIGAESNVMQSVPFSLVTAHNHMNDFRKAIMTAIDAGGDTNANASIVGAIVGTNVGLAGIPDEWIRSVPATKVAIDLADKLFDIFKK